MDCRMTLLLALGLSWGGFGCAQTTSTVARKDQCSSCQPCEEKPKRPPLPATCVAWAVCRERQAEKETSNPALKKELYVQAQQSYQQALKSDPGHLPAYAGLARTYMQMSQFEKALEIYHLALQKAPQESSLWFDLSICHCRAKQWEQAIRSLQKALELDKDNRHFIQTLGFCLARGGRLGDSVDMLCKVMSPAEAHYNVARMMYHMKRDDLCRHYVGLALQHDPSLAGALTLRAALNNTATSPLDPGGIHPRVQIGFEEQPE